MSNIVYFLRTVFFNPRHNFFAASTIPNIFVPWSRHESVAAANVLDDLLTRSWPKDYCQKRCYCIYCWLVINKFRYHLFENIWKKFEFEIYWVFVLPFPQQNTKIPKYQNRKYTPKHTEIQGTGGPYDTQSLRTSLKLEAWRRCATPIATSELWDDW